jgi:hypothetical protein
MTLSIPAGVNFRTVRFGLQTNTQSFVSPLSGTVQTLELTGARWAGDFILPPMTRAQAAEFQAFLQELGGMAGRFYGYDPSATSPRGNMSGSSIKVNGGSQTGKSIVCDGAAVSTTVLLKGDFIEVNGELKMIVADATSDGSGNVTLSFAPALRSSPPDNTDVITSNPKCTMMLVDDQQSFYDVNEVQHYGLRFSGIEAFV